MFKCFKVAPCGEKFEGKRWRVRSCGRVPPKWIGLYSDDENQYGLDKGVEIGQNQNGRHVRWMGEC